MIGKPLFPSDGAPYYAAMAAAAEEYDSWVEGRKAVKTVNGLKRRGIRVYSRKELDNSEEM